MGGDSLAHQLYKVPRGLEGGALGPRGKNKADGISLQMLLREGRRGRWGVLSLNWGAELGQGVLAPQEPERAKGRHVVPEHRSAPPPRSPASSSHHILSGAGRQGPASPLSPTAFRPPPQASCLGDLLPAPQIPDPGMVTTTGPALPPDGPGLWVPNFMVPLLFPPQSKAS